MTIPSSAGRDPAILDEIRQLTTELSDARARSILQSVIDAVALNPQPLPPEPPELGAPCEI